ncbi:MAG: SUMF1/EgtB/PvdO family nonheme iron enzyme [Spirochaetes bacterium]|jgi:formylglycine-generating enzyme required for sulfatase activity|nr:SUMF1/EgtB/PvdO family nonheme iron enzyme [Spirochaetota bacterium]
MPKKRAPEPPEIDEAVVTLRPLFGISPQGYLPWVFAGALVLLFFLILVLPGLVKPGAEVTVDSSPEGGSVYVDGIRVGSTPVTTFVERGAREIEIRKPFHDTVRLSFDVPARLVGSWIVPKRVTIREELRLADRDGLVRDAARRYSAWSLSGDQHAQYQYPPILSEAVETAYAAGHRTGHAVAGSLVERALPDVFTTAMLKDFARAALIDAARGSTPSPYSLADALQWAATTLNERPGLPFALATALPDRMEQQYRSHNWYQNFTAEYVTGYLPHTSESTGTDSLERQTILGYDFIRIPAGSYVQGLSQTDSPLVDPPEYQPPILTEQPEFLILASEVTRRLYMQFLEDRPQWTLERREELQDEGLVTEEYVAWMDGSDSSDQSIPVTHVSYFAVRAFADWFEDRLPETYAGFNVRLPREGEWEWAARAASAGPERAVFRRNTVEGPRALSVDRLPQGAVADLLGNVWEWTESWYHPAAYAAAVKSSGEGEAVRDTAGALPGDQRVVRGGSWINAPRSVGVVTRGAQDPAACTPFLGFRIVLVALATESEA